MTERAVGDPNDKEGITLQEARQNVANLAGSITPQNPHRQRIFKRNLRMIERSEALYGDQSSLDLLPPDARHMKMAFNAIDAVGAYKKDTFAEVDLEAEIYKVVPRARRLLRAMWILAKTEKRERDAII